MTGPKRMHLAARFPGAAHPVVRADPRSGPQIEFASFEHLARTAERGLFDFFLLAEEPRPGGHGDRAHDLDARGLNRYPDRDAVELRTELARYLTRTGGHPVAAEN
ncbi:hypothetical protein ACFTXB_18940, partial [Streptomyces sp. NPDC057074]